MDEYDYDDDWYYYPDYGAEPAPADDTVVMLPEFNVTEDRIEEEEEYEDPFAWVDDLYDYGDDYANEFTDDSSLWDGTPGYGYSDEQIAKMLADKAEAERKAKEQAAAAAAKAAADAKAAAAKAAADAKADAANKTKPLSGPSGGSSGGGGGLSTSSSQKPTDQQANPVTQLLNALLGNSQTGQKGILPALLGTNTPKATGPTVGTIPSTATAPGTLAPTTTTALAIGGVALASALLLR